ncbi:MAG: PAS domain S-box protein [Solirubrobacteraceae bacterium]
MRRVAAGVDAPASIIAAPQRAEDEVEERLLSILDDAPIMLYAYDREGRLLFGNREFERVLGIDRGAMIGRTRVDFFAPNDAAVHRAHDEAVLASGRGSRLEETLPQADGEHTYISDKFPLRDADGRMHAVVGISTDITERRRAEAGMRRSDARLAEAQGAYHIGNWEWDIAGGQIDWSDEVFRIVGEAPQGFAADYEGFLGRVHPDDRGMVKRAIDDALNGRRPYEVEYRIVRPDGEERVVAVRGETTLDAEGRPRTMSGTMHDVTERARAVRELAASEARYRQLLEQTSDGVWRVGVDERTNYVNPRMAEMLGYGPTEMLGRELSDFMDSEWLQTTQQTIARDRGHGARTMLECCFRRKDGEACWARVSSAALFDADDNYTGALALICDVTATKAREAELRSSQRFVSAITDSMGEGMFALDGEGRLTYINRAAEQLLGWTRDELADRSVHEATHYQHADGSPFPAEDCPLTTVRAGGPAVRVDDDVFTCRNGELLPVAYTAAPIVAGDRQGLVVVFNDITLRKVEDERRRRELEWLLWVGRIKEALDEHRFVLYAQPIIALPGRRTAAYELLLRMIDRDGTVITPGTFLPVAERFDLINEIDHWVTTEAVKMAAKGVSLHFNLSGKSLVDRDLVAEIKRLLSDFDADPGLLVCEITETAIAADEALAQAFVRQLVGLGLRLALDDFGTGYGGLTYLKRLQVELVKIDIEFVRDLPENPESQHVVKAIVNLAQGFGRKTVAEGVENEKTLQLLERLGVDYAQGFWIGRPEPLADGAPSVRSGEPL